MDYVVGSVADFISNKKFSKIKSRKEQLKSADENRSQIIDRKCGIDKNFNFPVYNFKFKNQTEIKNPLKSSEQSLNSFSTQTLNIDTSVKSGKLKCKTESIIKKGKTSLEQLVSNVKDDKKEPNHKKPKIDLLTSDNISINSDKHEIGKLRKISDGKNQISKKLLTEKDFKENTVFVGNIPINFDKQKILKIFSKFGEIQSARIRCVPIADINISKKVAAIKKKFNPKRNSLVAYVKFKSQESVNAALKANGMVVNGHHLRVDSVEENKGRDNNKAVFVGGLPFDIEDDELWEFFQNCGKINTVRIIRDSQTSMGKGFGYVNFDSTASVELALQLNGQELKKRTINVKRCIKAKNKSKLNSFKKKKNNEISNQLLCKKSKKLKEKKKLKKENDSFPYDFQGKKACVKQKKKKKLSKAALHQRKLVKILNPS